MFEDLKIELYALAIKGNMRAFDLFLKYHLAETQSAHTSGGADRETLAAMILGLSAPSVAGQPWSVDAGDAYAPPHTPLLP